ncbi:MAG: glycosyltransferase [Candidatus Ancillula sp.]|jgi:cellulose synthase/poly-beta-1,6-N-acetylglucosamine synthase-like glycosyltransferase|nr:glycosyltransferase [Candidatus Ancillula sp.]
MAPQEFDRQFVPGGARIRKDPRFYVILVILWAVLIGFTFVPFVAEVFDADYEEHQLWLDVLLVFNALFISYFWLNGIKDILYVFNYWLNRRRKISSTEQLIMNTPTPQGKRVVLVYTTCDDIIEDSLSRSMVQDYENVKTVILDDSSDPEYLARVDAFALEHNLEVYRRKDRSGFKAGNLNNYLQHRTDYDYFAIIDSDEILPHDFVTNCLKYFEHYDNLGILQCNHIATRNENRFMSMFAKGVDSHWPVYQSIKTDSGFLSLLGHGAMISRACYEAVGRFPHTVAEDLCFSIEAREQGYFVGFAESIECEEQYPVDYEAFKKRHSKWTQGNMEFIKTYTGKIIKSRMSWFEKLDIVLFTYSLPLTTFFFLYVIMNVIIYPADGYSLHYPVWMLIPTIIFLCAPMVNDAIFHSRWMRPMPILYYLFYVFLLYGSMFYISLKASFFSLLGRKAKFIVTPKESHHVSLWAAIWSTRQEIVFAVTLIVISTVLDKSILPVFLIVFPSLMGFKLMLLSNKPAEKLSTLQSWEANHKRGLRIVRYVVSPLLIAALASVSVYSFGSRYLESKIHNDIFPHLQSDRVLDDVMESFNLRNYIDSSAPDAEKPPEETQKYIPGHIIGAIKFPSIDIEEPLMYKKASTAYIVQNSADPGEPDATVISTDDPTKFIKLNQLKKGDAVEIATNTAKFTYTVLDVGAATDIKSIVDNARSWDTLVMFAKSPMPGDPNYYFVTAGRAGG